jgi:hypothetical protein
VGLLCGMSNNNTVPSTLVPKRSSTDTSLPFIAYGGLVCPSHHLLVDDGATSLDGGGGIRPPRWSLSLLSRPAFRKWWLSSSQPRE